MNDQTNAIQARGCRGSCGSPPDLCRRRFLRLVGAVSVLGALPRGVVMAFIIGAYLYFRG
jgi:hypothetical protein